MFTTQQDYFNAVQSTFALFPKTPEEVKVTLEKAKKVVDAETANIKEVISTYNKAATGAATFNEITQANKKATELFVTTRFVAVMALPGAILALPFLSKIAEEYDFDFVPVSVQKEFKI